MGRSTGSLYWNLPAESSQFGTLRPTNAYGTQNHIRTLARWPVIPGTRVLMESSRLFSWLMSNSALRFGRLTDARLQSSLGQFRVLADQVLDDLVCVLVRSGRSRVDLDIVGDAVVQVLEQDQPGSGGLCHGSLGRGSMTCDANITTGTENGKGSTAHRCKITGGTTIGGRSLR